MGSADRIIRVIVAVVLIALFATNVLTGTWGMITLVVAGIFIATSLVSTCPLYLPFGIRTNRIRKHAN